MTPDWRTSLLRTVAVIRAMFFAAAAAVAVDLVTGNVKFAAATLALTAVVTFDCVLTYRAGYRDGYAADAFGGGE